MTILAEQTVALRKLEAQISTVAKRREDRESVAEFDVAVDALVDRLERVEGGLARLCDAVRELAGGQPLRLL